MAENAGSIYYEVDAHTQGLLRAEREIDQSTDKASRSLGKMERATKAANDEFGGMRPIARSVREETARMAAGYDRVANAANVAAAAIAVIGVSAGIGEAVRSVANFEQTMIGLQVVSGATEEQMKSLQSQARELGATTMFSAQEAGEAQKFLAQAGMDVNEVMSATPGVLQLATAAQIGLAEAADIASNVLGGMQMPVSELGRVNDTLAATAASANTNVRQLGQAFIDAGPIAANLGISVEETAAAIGIMSDAGIQASRAGTGFRGVIRQLTNVTSDGQKVLEKYGLTTQDVSVENHGLAQVLDTVRQAGIGSKDMFRLFGSEAQSAAAVLAAGSARVGELTGELRESSGAAADAADKLGSGLVGSMRTLQSVVSESVLQLGDSGLASALQSVIDTASGVIAELNGMGATFAETNDLSDEQRARYQSLAGAVEAFGKAVQLAAVLLAGRYAQALATGAAGLVKMAAATVRVNGVMVTLRTTLATLFGPVGIVVAAAGALYTFREELGLVEKPAKVSTQRIDDLTDAINKNSKAAVEAGIVQLTAEYIKLANEAESAQARIDELNAAQQDDRRGARANLQNDMKIEDSKRSLERISAEQKAAKESADELRQVLAGLGETTVETTDSTTDLNTEITTTTDSMESGSEKTNEFANELESLLDKLFPLEAQQKKYREEMALLEEAMERYPEKADKIKEAMNRLGRSTQTAGEAYGIFNARTKEGLEDTSAWEEWSKNARQNIGDWENVSVKAADTFVNSFSKSFEQVITRQKSLSDAFVDIIQDMASMVIQEIGKMIAQWLVLQAVQAMAGAPSGGGGGGSFAGIFDKGGRIGAGEWGIAGERGPEIIEGPANVISTRDTAAMMNAPSAGKMMGNATGARSAPTTTNVNINVVEDPNRAGEVDQRQSDDGSEVDADVFVSDIYNDGPRARALQDRFELNPRGK